MGCGFPIFPNDGLEVPVSAARDQRTYRSRLLPITDWLSRLPYWLLVALLLAAIMIWVVVSNPNYQVIFDAVRQGVWTTIYVSVISYVFAVLVGLLLALMRVYRSRLTQEISSLFVEVIRGIPMLVLLYFISFVGAPALVDLINWLGTPLINAGIMAELSIR